MYTDKFCIKEHASPYFCQNGIILFHSKINPFEIYSFSRCVLILIEKKERLSGKQKEREIKWKTSRRLMYSCKYIKNQYIL